MPPPNTIPFDILIGNTEPTTSQCGILGMAPNNRNRRVAIDLNQIKTWLLFGVQGSGKSYTLQVIAEQGITPIPNLNQLTAPFCGISIHYSEDRNYPSEIRHMRSKNGKPDQVEKLRRIWGAEPKALEDVWFLVPPRMVEARKKEYETDKVLPIQAAMSEVSIEDFITLMGATDEDSPFFQWLNLFLESHEGDISLEKLHEELEKSDLSEGDRQIARVRANFISRFLGGTQRLQDLVKEGRFIVIDLRDPTLTKSTAFRLIIVLLRILGMATRPNGLPYSKWVYMDEFHVYARNEQLVDRLALNVRLMRHYSCGVLFASQDPILVHPTIIELSNVILCNRIRSPRHLQHLRNYNSAWEKVSIADLRNLRPGQGIIWAGECSDGDLSDAPFRIDLRISTTHPGGSTKTPVETAAGTV